MCNDRNELSVHVNKLLHLPGDSEVVRARLVCFFILCVIGKEASSVYS